jgi:CheY-like chemotaxis protein
MMNASMGQCMRILDDALYFSKMEAGQLTLALEPLALRPLLRAEVRKVDGAALRAGVRLVHALDGERKEHARQAEDELVLLDPMRFSQVVQNLLSNALKFTARGGTVEVELVCEEVPVGDSDAAGAFVRARVSVRDTGCGIEADEIAALFQPFKQTRSGAKKEHSTGLGLPISRHIAGLFGGDIGVESTEGKGSTFWATFVLQVAPRMPASRSGSTRALLGAPARPPLVGQRAETTHPLARRPRVLIVDDSSATRMLLGRTVSVAGGVVVDSVGDGDEALQTLYSHHSIDEGSESEGKHGVTAPTVAVDLVLLDFCMPRLDGPSTARRLRALGFAGMIVGVTGNSSTEDQALFLASGADRVIIKPITRESVAEVVEAAARAP